MTLNLQKHAVKFLLLLISADLFFILIHILHLITTDAVGLAAQNHSPFVLGRDLGLAEAYQYVKEYWIVLLFIFLSLVKRKFIYLSWAILFMFLMMDDIFQFHERYGYIFANSLELVPAFNLRANDFGELLFTGIIGIVFSLILILPYLKSERTIKQICHHFFVLIGGLLVFGVVFDMIQIMFMKYELMFNIFGIIEDGGEMIIISIFCWYVYLLTEQPENKSPFNFL